MAGMGLAFYDHTVLSNNSDEEVDSAIVIQMMPNPTGNLAQLGPVPAHTSVNQITLLPNRKPTRITIMVSAAFNGILRTATFPPMSSAPLFFFGQVILTVESDATGALQVRVSVTTSKGGAGNPDLFTAIGPIPFA